MEKSFFLTFDMDWAIDEVLFDFYNLMKDRNVVGTIHVTHETKFLDVIREESILECGIHPNYNPLLMGEPGVGNIDDVLGNMKGIVPEAKCVRSHALTTSSIIARKYSEYGLKYDLNTLIPAQEGIKIKPYHVPYENITVLPFFYEDDIYLNFADKRGVDFYFGDSFDAPRIFNFHPIHLYLNTDCVETYEDARPYFKNLVELEKKRNHSRYGIRDFFDELVSYANANGWKSANISEGNWE